MERGIATAEAFGILNVRGLEGYKPAVIHALKEISKKSGDDFGAEREVEYIEGRLMEGRETAMWLFVDLSKVIEQHKQYPEAVAGMMTLDIWIGNYGIRSAVVSRLWTNPGLGEELAELARPHVKKWAVEHCCEFVYYTTERTSGFAHWLAVKGFEMRETIFRIRTEDL